MISRFSLFSVTVARSARAWRPRREPPPLTGRTTSVATRPELVPVHAPAPVSRDPDSDRAKCCEPTLNKRMRIYEDDSGNKPGRIGTARDALRIAANSQCDGHRARYCGVARRCDPRQSCD
ncbi:hypothetical protein [Lysobacter gummosus]|uniref:hypothetical protein n=1 Tax=Lysobacter gummosus TaxID=262324 RepID=UPI00362D5DB3